MPVCARNSLGCPGLSGAGNCAIAGSAPVNSRHKPQADHVFPATPGRPAGSNLIAFASIAMFFLYCNHAVIKKISLYTAMNIFKKTINLIANKKQLEKPGRIVT